MSIIHNALQKAQLRKAKLDEPIQLNARRKWQWQKTGKFFILLLFGLLVIFAGIQIINNVLSLSLFSRKINKPVHTHTMHLQLNGIFLSGADKMAMINNNMYALGDNIDGLKIVSIETNRINLKDDEHNVLLRL